METAFDILAAQYRRMLLSYARALLGGDRHEAEDVVQESFLVAHRRLETFRQDEDFGRWLRGIARNKVLESRRSSRQRLAVIDARISEGMEEVYSMFEVPVPGEEPWKDRMQRLVQHCVDGLSGHLRDTVVQIYREGQSLRGAASILDSSPAAVAQRLSRARDLIRKCVEERREIES